MDSIRLTFEFGRWILGRASLIYFDFSRNFLLLVAIAERRFAVPRSVLDAIKMGIWDFEPKPENSEYAPTGAMPGSEEKLVVLSERVQRGLPLWHPADRRNYEDGTVD